MESLPVDAGAILAGEGSTRGTEHAAMLEAGVKHSEVSATQGQVVQMARATQARPMGGRGRGSVCEALHLDHGPVPGQVGRLSSQAHGRD